MSSGLFSLPIMILMSSISQNDGTAGQQYFLIAKIVYRGSLDLKISLSN